MRQMTREDELEFLKNMGEDEAYSRALADNDAPPLEGIENIRVLPKSAFKPGQSIKEQFKKRFPARKGDDYGNCGGQ